MNESAEFRQPDDLENVIEIRDPAINIDDILSEVRAGLAARGYQTADFIDDFPAFAPDGFPGSDWVARLKTDPELSYLLEQLGEDYDRLTLTMDARPMAVPVGASLLLRVKQAVHSLVLFYTNQLGNRQAAVNATMLRALGKLAADNAALRRDQQVLRDEIAALQRSTGSNGR